MKVANNEKLAAGTHISRTNNRSQLPGWLRVRKKGATSTFHPTVNVLVEACWTG
jgi:hypothetical protein